MAMASRFQTGTPSSPWWKLPSAHHLHDFTISFLSAHLPKAPDTSSDGAQVDRESSFSKAMCSGISEQVKWATICKIILGHTLATVRLAADTLINRMLHDAGLSMHGS